ncbi:MAG: HAMP domain-containing histidine kinase [Chitinophagaceae bacterium]|nr:HAMP domain-containing histidine kinase [Chitinophagaceae bacterium]
MNLTYKINLLFTVIVSGLVLLLAFLIYTVSKQTLQEEFRNRLKTRAARTAQLYTYFKNDTTNLLQSLDATAPPALVNKNINIYNEQKEVLYEYHDDSTAPVKPDSSWFAKAIEKGDAFFSSKGKDIYLHYNNSPAHPFCGTDCSRECGSKRISHYLKTHLPALSTWRNTLRTGCRLFVFHEHCLTYKRNHSRCTTDHFANLSQRLYTGKNKDELSQLNNTFNDLLNRLEESFAIQRRFISNASHELSTPLTSISSQIEVALQQNRNVEEYRHVLNSVLEDAQELNSLTRNLLEIAKAGTHGTISLDRVRLDEILLKSHADILKQHKEYKVQLDFNELPDNENECLVYGNSHLLSSAFKNIIENGCKYSPDGSIRVQLTFHGPEAEIVFINKSDMLTSEEISKLFEPFYRSTNTGEKPGTGLGLTLVKRIISLHKGVLSINYEAEKGTIVTITLPTLRK